MNIDIDTLIADAPDNFVIKDAICRCYEVVSEHSKICCAVSGGWDSDIMVDMLIRCGARYKTDFVSYNTGLEYQATLQHLDNIEKKYNIKIKRIKAFKPIPTCVKEYGVPFWSKYVSEMLHRLQYNDFKFEDEPYDVLIKRYPNCRTALRWWCNDSTCNMYRIDRSPYLKEFIIENPPKFKISNKCCYHTKKKLTDMIQIAEGYDLVCVGVRKAEEGIRASQYKSCFNEGSNANHFRPVFWFSDKDKIEYCDYYGVTQSRCYTEYGLPRTGCVGCPFAKNYEQELSIVEKYEPKLIKAANNIFNDSYTYTRQYLKFREERKRLIKNAI